MNKDKYEMNNDEMWELFNRLDAQVKEPGVSEKVKEFHKHLKDKLYNKKGGKVVVSVIKDE